MPATPERPSTPGSRIEKAIKVMPWYQRVVVKAIGLALMIGPAYAGVRLVPHLIHEDTSTPLAALVLGFLAALMFVGLLITVPKAAAFVASLIPKKWKRDG